MKPIPMDTESFVEIRTSKPQKLYVDKTAYFYRLIMDPQARRFFLARPRRFGKSMMISTLKAIFQGRRDLFTGLAIDKLDYDWQVYPVIHLDLGRCAAAEYDHFIKSLPVVMERALMKAGWTAYDKNISPAANFGEAIDYFADKGKQCVVLIDEYDDPVAKALKDPAEANRVRNELATVYAQLKSRTSKIRFLMITGVSKFCKMSVFSTISNLVDLSFEDAYASMLGYTENELDTYFTEHITAHAALMGIDIEEYRRRLRLNFNGYRFWRMKGDKVYNPVSINWNLAEPEPFFQFCWTQTGRPSMLMNFMERGDMLSLDPESIKNVDESDFDVTDLAHLRALPMLYQTGYLTIKDFNPYIGSYELCVPDDEVRRDLALLMASQVVGEDVSWAARLGKQLLNHDWEPFFVGLKALYAAATYGSTEGRVHESSYLRNLLFLLRGQGIQCLPEVNHAQGRIDLVAHHLCCTFIFELKVDKPAEIAMSQAERQNYAAPYLADGKPIWLIGLSFDSKTHQLVGQVVEEVVSGGEVVSGQ